MTCVKCGSELNPAFRFCPLCGAPVTPPAATPAQPTQTFSQQQPRQQIVSRNVPRMITVQGGTFIMGTNEFNRKISLVSFGMSETPITQRQFEYVMGKNPSKLVGAEHPVECVNWCEALIFCNTLSMMQNLMPCYSIGNATDLRGFDSTSPVWKRVVCNFTANGYRLPTEAEWEYAARSGKMQNPALYSGGADINQVAWYGENSNVSTHDVGSKAPNALGLYDMCGNVAEWCWDYVGDLGNIPLTNPHGPQTGNMHIKRGGSWLDDPPQCTVFFRSGSSPTGKSSNLGFRVSRSLIENVL